MQRLLELAEDRSSRRTGGAEIADTGGGMWSRYAEIIYGLLLAVAIVGAIILALYKCLTWIAEGVQ